VTSGITPSVFAPAGPALAYNVTSVKERGYGRGAAQAESPKNASKWNAEPRYSPDGEKIAYMGPDGEIYTIGARGGGKSRVTNNVFAYGLSWGTRP
jgi:Tol biopolymer transport system component